MARPARYLLDASVLIQAHRRYYGLDLCPGFWDCVLWQHKQGVMRSIDRVKKEIDAGKDVLAQWVKDECPAGFFESTGIRAVGDQYGEIIAWAHAQKRYRPEALSAFATAADGWLVAHARENGFFVVTQEGSAPESRTEVKVPDVCEAFKVPCIDTFEMLEKLNVRFTWKP
jgi:hypothetical protein